jgi:hypothetical protein
VGGAHRLRRPEILAELAADLSREPRVVDRSQLPLPPLFVGRERVLGFPPSPSAVEVEDSPWRGEGRGEGTLWLSVELLTCPKPSTQNVSRDSLFLLRRSPQRDTVRRTATKDKPSHRFAHPHSRDSHRPRFATSPLRSSVVRPPPLPPTRAACGTEGHAHASPLHDYSSLRSRSFADTHQFRPMPSWRDVGLRR